MRDAVVVLEAAVVEEHADGSVTMLMRDALSGVPDEGVRPDLGAGILREASVSSAGTALAPMGTAVTPALVSLAASRGLDSIEIVRPPVVGTLILGSSLLDHGLPRNGRVRDALGAAIPAFVGALGARGNPAVRAPDTLELLTGEIDDANVDVLITTGSTAPGPDNHLRGVLRDLNVRWLVDGVSVTPGSQMLLARLVDGRFLVGLPGEPTAALAGLITLVSPLISTLCDRPRVDRRRSAVLMEDTQPADYADDTALVPVALESSAAGTQARPFPMTGPEGQIGWIPYIIERADKVWEDNRGWGGIADLVPEPPSTYYYRQIFGCFFDDNYGLANIEAVGVDNVCFETDYPHSDSTWPHSKEVAIKQMVTSLRRSSASWSGAMRSLYWAWIWSPDGGAGVPDDLTVDDGGR